MTASARTSPGRLRVVFAATVVLQLVGVYLPTTPPVPADSPVPIDKVAHAVLFGLPAFVAGVAFLRPALPWLVLLVHAPVSEWLQREVLPHRSGDWHDAAADVVGLVVGAWLGIRAGRRTSDSLID